MAGFTGNPRIWSRLRFIVEQYPSRTPYYLYDRTYGGPITGIAPYGVMSMTLRPDHLRFAFSTALWSQYANPTIASRIYNIVNSPEDEFAMIPLPWDQYGASQATQGLTVPNVGTEASPLWDLSDATTPTSGSAHAWTGEYSDDGTVFASILRLPSDPTKVYLSVKQNGTTLVLRQLLGITHIDYWRYNQPLRKVEIRMVVRAANDIWLFHYNESSPGAGDRRLFLSVWNGSAIASTTQLDLGTYDVLTFDAIRGTTGLIYLVYALADPDNEFENSPVGGRSFVRSINETTKTLSAVLHTSPILRRIVPGDVSYTFYRSTLNRESDRLPSNRAFPYKGKNYIVHVFSGQAVVVYTYEDSDPSNITLLRWGFIEKLTRYWSGTPALQYMNDEMLFGRVTGIEYDPVSDTAFLVSMVPNVPNSMVGPLSNSTYDAVDRERIYVTRHWQALDAPTWDQHVEVVDELSGYVFQQGSSSYEEVGIDILGYVPSRYGVGATGMLFFQSRKGTGGSSTAPYIHVVRTQCWHDPVDIVGEVDVTLVPEVSVTAARTYDTGIDLQLGPAISIGGVRSRFTQWSTYWNLTVDTSVNGEVHIDLTPDISITGNLATTHLGEVEIDFNDSLDISVSGEVETAFFLTHRYWSVGTTFLDEFNQYMNEERANVWGLPPIQIMGYTPYSLDILRNIDIAQRHSDNQAAARWYAHGAEIFPVGWQTAMERLAKVTTDGAENIQLQVEYFELFPEFVPTAWDVYYSWKTSPPHYANMMTDWDAGVAPGTTPYVFHSLAYTAGLMARYNGGGPPWDTYPIVEYPEEIWNDPRRVALYLTDNFMVIKESTVETTLVERWQTDELFALLLEERWSMSGLMHLSQQHSALWGMTLHAQHELVYGSRVTASHVIQNTHTIVAGHEAVHSNSVGGFATGFTILYDMDRLHAVASNELQWTRTLAAQHTLEYDEAPRIAKAFDAPYGEYAKLLAYLDAPYGVPIPVAQVHAIQYAIQIRLRKVHTVSSPLGPFVKKGQEAVYDLLLRNPTGTTFEGVYDLLSANAGVVFAQPQSVAFLNGRSLEIADGYITCDYESPGYVFECDVADLEFVRGAAIGDRLDVVFEGTQYVFFLSNLSSSSAERSAAEKVTIKGLSPVFMLDAPYAETVTYAPDSAKLFSEIIQEALGLSVDFSRHIDWMVPYGRAQSASQTPLALVRGFLESVGSRLLSNPDGTLYVLPRYPVGFDALPSGVPPHALDETTNLFTKGSSYDYGRGYNRFRVRDSDTGYGDMIEFDQSTSIATVWVSPYRTTWRLDCTTTPGILLDAQGETVEEKEEVWDFQGGSATAAYPILELVSLTWITDGLGGVSFEPHSTKVSAPVTTNHGYGLAKVVYRAKCSKFLLTSSAPIEATQLIIVEL